MLTIRAAANRAVLGAGAPLEELSLTSRIVALVSGAGTNLQALIDASADPAFGATVVAVGADRDGIEGLTRAKRAAIPTFVVPTSAFESRAEWDMALADAVSTYQPDLVLLAGFMKIVGQAFLERFPDLCVNTHPALLPAFPGAHGVRDALAYGAKVTGVTVHIADAGVDTGPIIAQQAVPVLADDTEAVLHERIKNVERALLVDTVGRMAREGFRVEGRQVYVP